MVERIGLEAVLEDQDFIDGIQDYNNALKSATQSTKQAQGGLSSLGQTVFKTSQVTRDAHGNLMQTSAAFTQLSSSALKASPSIDNVGLVLGDVDTFAGEASDGMQQFGQESDKTSGILDKLASAAQTIGLGVIAKQAAQAFIELGKFGMQVEAAEQRFVAFAGSGAEAERILAAIADRTQGTISRMDAMQAATKFMTLGLASNADEAARFIQMATRLGDQTATVTQRVDDFAALLANTSTPRLDNFGISSARVKAQMAGLQAQTEGLTREEAFLQATLEQGSVALEKLGDAGLEATKASDQLSANIDNLRASLGKRFAEDVNSGTQALVKLTGAINDSFDAQSEMMRLFGDTASMEAMQEASKGNMQALTELGDRMRGIHATTERLSLAAERYAETAPQVGQASSESADMMEVYNQAIATSQANSDAAAGAQLALAQAQRDAAQAAADSKSAYLDSAAALGEMSKAQFATSQIDSLRQSMESGDISHQKFVEAQEAVLVKFGLLTEQEQNAQGAIDNITTAFANGEISAERYATELEAIQFSLENSVTAGEQNNEMIERAAGSMTVSEEAADQFAEAMGFVNDEALEGRDALEGISGKADDVATATFQAQQRTQDLAEQIGDLTGVLEGISSQPYVVNVEYRTTGTPPSAPESGSAGEPGGGYGAVGGPEGGFQFGGRVANQGVYVAGERGPELLSLPPGTEIFNNRQTGDIFDAVLRGQQALTMPQSTISAPVSNVSTVNVNLGSVAIHNDMDLASFEARVEQAVVNRLR